MNQDKNLLLSRYLSRGRDREIIGKHRKLKPTFHDRTAWGEGDGPSLRVYEHPYGRISGLNCWEHQLTLSGYALASQGTQVHIAAWPGREPDKAPPPPTGLWPRQILLSRAFASQAGCYVIGAAGINRKEDYLEIYRELVTFEHHRGSCIIDPRGEIVTEPEKETEQILVATGSLDVVRSIKAAVDIGGHYNRPDVFRFEILR